MFISEIIESETGHNIEIINQRQVFFHKKQVPGTQTIQNCLCTWHYLFASSLDKINCIQTKKI